MQVFLSHNSKGKKHYVRVVANRIGSDRIVHDEISFEEGLKSIDEINRTLEINDLFVVFLSKNSIELDWLQHELFREKDLLDDTSKRCSTK